MNIANAVRALATLSWVAALGILALAVVRSSRGKGSKTFTRLVIVLGVLALILTTLGAGMVFIQPDERGVVISAISPQGYRSEVLEPGLRWVIPFAENVVTYTISRQTYTMSIAPSEGHIQGDDSVAGRTSDGQVVLIDASVIYAVDPAQVASAVVACIGPTTADAVADLGIDVHVVPSEYTIAGLTDALDDYYRERESTHVQA